MSSWDDQRDELMALSRNKQAIQKQLADAATSQANAALQQAAAASQTAQTRADLAQYKAPQYLSASRSYSDGGVTDSKLLQAQEHEDREDTRSRLNALVKLQELSRPNYTAVKVGTDSDGNPVNMLADTRTGKFIQPPETEEQQLNKELAKRQAAWDVAEKGRGWFQDNPLGKERPTAENLLAERVQAGDDTSTTAPGMATGPAVASPGMNLKGMSDDNLLLYRDTQKPYNQFAYKTLPDYLGSLPSLYESTKPLRSKSLSDTGGYLVDRLSASQKKQSDYLTKYGF